MHEGADRSDLPYGRMTYDKKNTNSFDPGFIIPPQTSDNFSNAGILSNSAQDVRDGGVNFYVLLQLLQALFVNHEREAEQELVQVLPGVFIPWGSS